MNEEKKQKKKQSQSKRVNDEQSWTIISYVYAIEFAENLIGIFRIARISSHSIWLNVWIEKPNQIELNVLWVSAFFMYNKVLLNQNGRVSNKLKQEKNFMLFSKDLTMPISLVMHCLRTQLVGTSIIVIE